MNNLFIFKYIGEASQASQAFSSLKAKGVKVIEETPKMILGEAKESVLQSIDQILQKNWKIIPYKTYQKI